MQTLLTGGHFYEGARWHDGHFWVSDLYAGHILKVEVDGSSEIVAELDDQPSGLGWMPDGSLLVVGMTKRQIWRRSKDGQFVLHADLKGLARGFANDMIVDATGRAYVTHFGFDLFLGAPPAPSTLLCVEPTGEVRIVASDLLFPNGVAVTSDGGTLIVAETFGGRLTAFSILADGSLADRRCLAQLGNEPSWESVHTLLETNFAPDGCAIDKENCIWVADAVGGRVARVSSDGRILEERRPPDGLGVYSCALGGADGKTLLLCTAPDFDDIKRKATPEAKLFTTTVSVPRA